MRSRRFWNWTRHERAKLLQPHALTSLKGIGPHQAARLERLGIREPRDLLFHLPLRYQDRTRISPIGGLQRGNDALVVARISLADVHVGRRRSLLVQVMDQTGMLTLRFFHFSLRQQKSFIRGYWIWCFGEVRSGPDRLEMIHPEYRISQDPPQAPIQDALTPVYPTTEGIGANKIRELVAQALTLDDWSREEPIPTEVRKRHGLSSTWEAIRYLHRPPPDADMAALIAGCHPMQKRLALEELTAHRLTLLQVKQQRHAQLAPKCGKGSPSWRELESQLGFSLTGAQQRVIRDIVADLNQTRPTLRLIQGDVGSGKTVVAAAAALHAIDAGYQVALMAPTELLAEQHRDNFTGWFQSIHLNVAWLVGKMPAAQRRRTLSAISTGETAMVVGTHALFQDQVDFHRLGLIIVDEQHRFGVDQRLALRNKGERDSIAPHQLIMSATPIPRSLAMIFLADCDVSNIDELPPGRQAVNTVVMPDTRREELMHRIHTVCADGQQVYWVCPLIQESEKLQAQAATETCTLLQSQLSGLRVGLVHGRLKPPEKDRIMQAFRDRTYDLLVATTVIEVGLDVPNASLMVIENAERLGLAQLHQLRGRVGRGAKPSNCVLLYHPPLGQAAKERLALLRHSHDGFTIAQKDLEQRGPGDILGTRQTGLQQMRIADSWRDRALFPKAQRLADDLSRHGPDAITVLTQRWIPHPESYANV